jgi:F-type H+-transporting ATPase subunit b
MNLNLTLVAQAITFAIFIWFTTKFIWPYLMRAIEARQKQIADGLAAAERGRVELAEASKKSEAALADARARAQEIIAAAEKRAAQMVDEAKTTAKAEGDRLVAGAKAEITQEVARAKESLREQVAALAVAGAEKILRREVDPKAHAQMLAGLKSELK